MEKKLCFVELFGNEKLLTNYFDINPVKRAKLDMMNKRNRSGVYKTTFKTLEEIAKEYPKIFLRNPGNLVDNGKIAFERLLDYVDYSRIIPYTGWYRNRISIVYNRIPDDISKLDIDNNDALKSVISTELNELYSNINNAEWNLAFLMGWVKLHRGDTNYELRGAIEFNDISDVTSDSYEENVTIRQNYKTITLWIYGNRCAHYLVPMRIFRNSKGKIVPIRYQQILHIGIYGASYEYEFIIDKDYLSLDTLKYLRKYGSLVGGTALYDIDEESIGGFNYRM